MAEARADVEPLDDAANGGLVVGDVFEGDKDRARVVKLSDEELYSVCKAGEFYPLRNIWPQL